MATNAMSAGASVVDSTDEFVDEIVEIVSRNPIQHAAIRKFVEGCSPLHVCMWLLSLVSLVTAMEQSGDTDMVLCTDQLRVPLDVVLKMITVVLRDVILANQPTRVPVSQLSKDLSVFMSTSVKDVTLDCIKALLSGVATRCCVFDMYFHDEDGDNKVPKGYFGNTLSVKTNHAVFDNLGMYKKMLGKIFEAKCLMIEEAHGEHKTFLASVLASLQAKNIPLPLDSIFNPQSNEVPAPKRSRVGENGPHLPNGTSAHAATAASSGPVLGTAVAAAPFAGSSFSQQNGGSSLTAGPFSTLLAMPNPAQVSGVKEKARHLYMRTCMQVKTVMENVKTDETNAHALQPLTVVLGLCLWVSDVIGSSTSASPALKNRWCEFMQKTQAMNNFRFVVPVEKFKKNALKQLEDCLILLGDSSMVIFGLDVVQSTLVEVEKEYSIEVSPGRSVVVPGISSTYTEITPFLTAPLDLFPL